MKKDSAQTTYNHEQKVNEGFSGENIPDRYNPSGEPQQTETETDRSGHSNTVKRARNLNEAPQPSSNGVSRRGISSRKTKEHEDRNGDVASNRYPASHPENDRNRGNIKLDE